MKKSRRKRAAGRILEEILERKMCAYSATAAAALLAGGASAQAGMHYTAANISLTGPSDSYAIDFNGDANADVKIALSGGQSSSTGMPFTWRGSSSSWSSTYPVTVRRGVTNYFRSDWNGVSATLFGPGAIGIQALSASDNVSAGNSWGGAMEGIAWNSEGAWKATISWIGTHFPGSSETGHATNYVLGPYTWDSSWGNFIGQSGKYLGVRFKIGDDIHFGWVQVDVNADANQATINGYGYQDVPGATAHAGTVPEPGSLALLAIGAAGIAARRRKKAMA